MTNREEMMASNTLAAVGLSIESLLLNAKSLLPLPSAALTELNHIQALKLDDTWTEENVRANVIDLIVRLLGYQKGEVFSVDRERKLDFLGKRVYVDYAVTLWQENF